MIEETLDLLYIYKDNCGPCDSMYPILESFSNKRPEINLYKFNFDDNDEFVDNIKLQLGVIATPFFAAFKNNSVNTIKLAQIINMFLSLSNNMSVMIFILFFVFKNILSNSYISF
jgi:thiol-disulfide isomerase/thioredoxin